MKLFSSIIKSLGPSVFHKESVDIFSKDELERIKSNFLIKKLKLSEDESLEEKFKLITHDFIKSDQRKDRVFFYYFIVKHFQKEEIFMKLNKDHRSDMKNPFKSIYNYLFKKNNISKSNEDRLIDFGDEFIKKQKDLDRDIFEIVDKNFASLY
ncbi:MAG: DUF2853 family protein [Saprospiraceae bacterium]